MKMHPYFRPEVALVTNDHKRALLLDPREGSATVLLIEHGQVIENPLDVIVQSLEQVLQLRGQYGISTGRGYQVAKIGQPGIVISQQGNRILLPILFKPRTTKQKFYYFLELPVPEYRVPAIFTFELASQRSSVFKEHRTLAAQFLETTHFKAFQITSFTKEGVFVFRT